MSVLYSVVDGLTEAEGDPVVSVVVLDDKLGESEEETEGESETDTYADTDSAADFVVECEGDGEFEAEGLPVIAFEDDGENDGYDE